jgi:transcriptional regulator with XRE-family HTH domain
MTDGAPRQHRVRQSDALPDDIGQRLRGVREERGIGLRELSRVLDISPSALSQIETGRTRPSVMTLYAIVSELQMSLDELLRVGGTRPPPTPPVIHDGQRLPAVCDAVLHAESRRRIDLGTGVRWERLTPLSESNADFLFVTYEVGSSSSWEPIAARHAAREYGLVLSGRIRIALGLAEHELGPTDSIAFDTSQPHRIDNVGDGPATAVWCMVGAPRQEG